MTVIKNGKSKEQAFISPQAKIISNLFTHCQYKYLKESGKLKKNGNELERVVVLKSSDEVPRASGGAMISPGAQRQLQQEPVRSIPAKSAVNNLKKSDSFGKSLASKMKGSVEKLNDVMGSSSNLKNSAGNLNRSLNQLGRTMTKKLNMQEEDIPVNTAKVKVSSEVLNEMSAVLPKGYKEGSYQITAPTVKQNFNATVAPTNEQLQKIRQEVQPQSQQIQGTPPQPAQQTVERVLIFLSRLQYSKSKT